MDTSRVYKKLRLGERPNFTCALITNLKAEAIQELRKAEEMSAALAYIYHFYLHGPDGTRSKYLHRGSVNDPTMLSLYHLLSAGRIIAGKDVLRFSLGKRGTQTTATLLHDGQIEAVGPTGLATYATPEEWVASLQIGAIETVQVG